MRRRLVVGVLVLAVLMLGALSAAARPLDTRAAEAALVVGKCQADLAKRLGVPVAEVSLAETQPAEWPNAALGLPEIGQTYAQVRVPGLRVILSVRNEKYLYDTAKDQFKYGGPMALWAYSELFLKPVPNDPNLNGDLYQASLLGTNPVRVATGVTDFYPQANGAILIKRRESRSGHSLLLVNAKEPGQERVLYGAFDFGAAALNERQDEWASIVRPTIGGEWSVAVGTVGGARGTERVFESPKGERPMQLAWAGERVMILTEFEGQKARPPLCWEISPHDPAAQWQHQDPLSFAGRQNFMLNKSERLEVSSATDQGRTAVEVARVWFTGERTLRARILDFSDPQPELLKPYVFIRGRVGGDMVVYTVDFTTGETIRSFHGEGTAVKPFKFPPLRNPMTMK